MDKGVGAVVDDLLRLAEFGKALLVIMALEEFSGHALIEEHRLQHAGATGGKVGHPFAAPVLCLRHRRVLAPGAEQPSGTGSDRSRCGRRHPSHDGHTPI